MSSERPFAGPPSLPGPWLRTPRRNVSQIPGRQPCPTLTWPAEPAGSIPPRALRRRPGAGPHADLDTTTRGEGRPAVSSAEERLDSFGGESRAVFLLNLLAEVGGCGVEVLVMQHRLDRVKEPLTT